MTALHRAGTALARTAPARTARGSTWFREHALAAARAGFPVFPVLAGDKVPSVEGWEQAASTDPDRIRSWWPPGTDRNIGLAVGRAGVVVLDLDDSHGATPPPQWAGARGGSDVLARLAAAAGQPDPTDTYTVTTPRHGQHRYFAIPAGLMLRNTQARLGWRVDTRAAGGFVIGAGSRTAGGRYRVRRPGRIAPLPPWLAAALTPAPPPPPAVLPQFDDRSAGYVAAALAGAAAAVQNAPEGTRHRTRLHQALALGTLVGAGVLDDATARATLLAAAAGHINPGDTPRQVARDIDDGLRYGRARPRLLPRPAPASTEPTPAVGLD